MNPPYWQTEGYGVPFGIEQYEEMASMLAKGIISLGLPCVLRALLVYYAGSANS
tara:strand:+ start:51527 stop:51688 length:162 start_codon:yes stop_codon:yes gene_type:complete